MRISRVVFVCFFFFKVLENESAVDHWDDEHHQGREGEDAAWGLGLAVECFLLVAATATVIVMEAGACRIELAANIKGSKMKAKPDSPCPSRARTHLGFRAEGRWLPVVYHLIIFLFFFRSHL